MNRLLKIGLAVIYAAAVVGLIAGLVSGHTVAVLQPQGMIGAKERDLILTATLLMLLVVVPVFVMTGTIAWRYRAGNTKAAYRPDWDHNLAIELTWWAIPAIIILALAIITWRSSHELDPFKPLPASAQPLTIQVVALPWKWLFIYPQQGIATVNFVEFPAGTPVNFEITADAPMNSFWIPQLGGQIYAMPGMSTQLHLEANGDGVYAGSSANLSGTGFAGMRFAAKSTSPADFAQWVQLVQLSRNRLDDAAYAQLAKPSQNLAPAYYTLSDPQLYNMVIDKYMLPAPKATAAKTAGGAK